MDGTGLGVAGGALCRVAGAFGAHLRRHRVAPPSSSVAPRHQMHHSPQRVDISGSTLFRPRPRWLLRCCSKLFVTVIVLGLDRRRWPLVGYAAAFHGMFQHWNAHAALAGLPDPAPSPTACTTARACTRGTQRLPAVGPLAGPFQSRGFHGQCGFEGDAERRRRHAGLAVRQRPPVHGRGSKTQAAPDRGIRLSQANPRAGACPWARGTHVRPRRHPAVVDVQVLACAPRSSRCRWACATASGCGCSPSRWTAAGRARPFGLALAIQNLTWGVAGLFAGMLADRFGAFRVLVAGGLMYAAGLASMALATSPRPSPSARGADRDRPGRLHLCRGLRRHRAQCRGRAAVVAMGVAAAAGSFGPVPDGAGRERADLAWAGRAR